MSLPRLQDHFQERFFSRFEPGKPRRSLGEGHNTGSESADIDFACCDGCDSIWILAVNGAGTKDVQFARDSRLQGKLNAWSKIPDKANPSAFAGHIDGQFHSGANANNF
jgi:hypothetical protein